MSDEKTYLKKDLSRYFDKNRETPRWPSRTDMIETYLPDAEYDTIREGSYQGVMAIVLKHDGYIWLTEDSYGSCSGCDYCQGDPTGWAEDVLGSAYCFENLDDLKTYVKNSDAIQYESSYQPLSREDVIEMAEKLVKGEEE